MTADLSTRPPLGATVRRRTSSWAGRLLLLAVGLLMLLPFWWSLATALVSPEKAFSVPPTWIPTSIQLDNFRQVFDLIPFTQQLLNSLKITTIVVIGSLVTSCLAAYAFARLRFPGRDLLFVAFLSALMIPTQVTLIPTYILMRYVGLLDTHTALWLPGLIQVFSIFLLRQHFMSMPIEIEEAARIDGAGRVRILLQILLPLSGPVLSALAIFTAERYWNDFFAPNIFLTSPDKMTIPVGLVSLQSQFGASPTTVLFAGIALILVPILVLFLFTQKRLTEGVTLTGVSR